jgi:hypothetical protein
MSSLDFDNVKSNKSSSDIHTRQYTCRTSLGANSVPDKFVEEDLQQPYRLKISFEEVSKDIKISLKSYEPI